MFNPIRIMDESAIKELEKYLDKVFYPNIQGLSKFKRNDEVELQFKGVDVIAEWKGKLVYIDEKAQISYLNHNRPTFAFELATKNRQGKYMDGWFLAEDNMTDMYNLIFPNTIDLSLTKENVRAEDFINVECLLIEKVKLQNWLTEHRISKDTLKKIAYQLQTGMAKASDFGGISFHYAYSPHLKEAPVNLVVKKKLLEELATYRYTCKNNFYLDSRTIS